MTTRDFGTDNREQRNQSADLNTLIRNAVALSWFTIIYNLIEGVVAMWFGIAEESFALFGFGADSFIEVASAVLVLWRFRVETGVSIKSMRREKTATLGIGILFLLLASVTVFGASAQLWSQSHPETTLPGMIVSSVSLSFMFFLWKSKTRVADGLNSLVMRSDASCSLACIKLSAVLFVGSSVYFFAPFLWWADAVAALILSLLVAKEGFEIVNAARRGQIASCCGSGREI